MIVVQTFLLMFPSVCQGLLRLTGNILRNSAALSSSSATTDVIREAQQEMNKMNILFSQYDNPPLLWSSHEEAQCFIDEKLDAILFDCDGVLYRSPDEIPGAGDCIRRLLDAKKEVFFVTNNAASNRRQLQSKLQKVLGVDGLTEDMMVSSSFSCSEFLRKKFLPSLDLDPTTQKRIHVIGSEGLCEEIRQAGFLVTCGDDSDTSSMSREDLATYTFPEDPIDAVVVGHDINFTFRKLCIGNVLLQRNSQAPLIATNLDSFDLVGNDARHIPGNGCVVKALEYSSGRTAINVGKPSKLLADIVLGDRKIDPSRSMIVGDRLDTDIQFGQSSGMYSALVLTGVTSASQIEMIVKGESEEPMPSIIMPHVGIMA